MIDDQTPKTKPDTPTRITYHQPRSTRRDGHPDHIRGGSGIQRSPASVEVHDESTDASTQTDRSRPPPTQQCRMLLLYGLMALKP
jgi:hypothetical protein